MKESIHAIMERWGQALVREREGEETALRGILQPSLGKSGQMPEDMSPVGWLDGRRWLYIGEEELRADDIIRWKDQRYRVRVSQSFFVGEELLYWWANLEQEAA